ncbi:hypothetical protein O3P69_013204 [Scylla paramamosain]|uniref:ARID domain-containing protein n=1 Tax=Scylla paramamosain TaxID=85552 RepID=A0AAW0TZU8_SCYPA
MEQEDSLGLMGGRDSPLKPDGGVGGGVVEGEDILAKLRQQVSAASIFSQAAREGGLGSTPPPGSPNNNNNNNNGHNLYDRLHTLLQAKMKREEDGEGEEDSRDLVLRAEALHRQRESLLSSPQALMNAMRGGGPPSLVPPGPHLPFIPSTVGLPPTTQMPPTPGSAGSRDSSGNGARTPSHTPEPHQSQQSWSFEEQFKQVREPTKHSSFEEDKRKLYELSDDVKRKEFLDELFSFMQKRGTPINRLPIMAKQVLDLYELYKLVVERGGLVDVINKKLWQEIIKGLKLPSSITSAAFTLRTQPPAAGLGVGGLEEQGAVGGGEEGRGGGGSGEGGMVEQGSLWPGAAMERGRLDSKGFSADGRGRTPHAALFLSTILVIPNADTCSNYVVSVDEKKEGSRKNFGSYKEFDGDYVELMVLVVVVVVVVEVTLAGNGIGGA